MKNIHKNSLDKFLSEAIRYHKFSYGINDSPSYIKKGDVKGAKIELDDSIKELEKTIKNIINRFGTNPENIVWYYNISIDRIIGLINYFSDALQKSGLGVTKPSPAKDVKTAENNLKKSLESLKKVEEKISQIFQDSQAAEANIAHLSAKIQKIIYELEDID